MKEAWYKTGGGDRDQIKNDVALGARAFERLEKLLSAKLKSPPKDYSISNWAYLMADTNGYNRALTEVLELIKGD